MPVYTLCKIKIHILYVGLIKLFYLSGSYYKYQGRKLVIDGMLTLFTVCTFEGWPA